MVPVGRPHRFGKSFYCEFTIPLDGSIKKPGGISSARQIFESDYSNLGRCQLAPNQLHTGKSNSQQSDGRTTIRYATLSSGRS